jgi:hypothetical protein
MPKVLAAPENNLYFYIYSNDHHPPHVHVFKGKKAEAREAKINIGNEKEPPSIVSYDNSLRDGEIKQIWQLVAKNQKLLLEKWEQIHGISKLDRSD